MNLPTIITVQDYHEFDYLQMKLKKIIKNIKIKEVGFATPYYYGLVWVGKKPAKSEIRKLLIKAGWINEH